MRSIILTPVFMIISLMMFSQEWSLISENKMNFKKNGSAFITNQIFVDSTTVEGEDLILHLNRVACDSCYYFEQGEYDCEMCYGLYDLPQFLGKKVGKFDDGSVNLEFDDHLLHLDLTAQIGDTFVYDEINAITGTIVSIEEQTFIEITDSVKMIQCSNGDSYLVSKAYGIIEKNGLSEHYVLAGYQDTDLGEHTLLFSEIFNLDPGDSLEYALTYGGIEQSYHGTRRIIIDSEEISGDSLIYQFHGREDLTIEYWNGPDLHIHHNISGQFIFEPSIYPYLPPAYPDQLIRCDNAFSIPIGYGDGIGTVACTGFEILRYSADPTGIMTIQYGQEIPPESNGWSNSPVMFYKPVGYPGILYPIDFLEEGEGGLTCDILYQLGGYSQEYKKGLGLTFSIHSDFESISQIKLVAYSKNDVSGGEFSGPFAVTVDENVSYSNSIFPNPTSGILHLSNSNLNKVTIEIYDQTGRLIRSMISTGSQPEINVSELPCGVYFMKVVSEESSGFLQFIKE